MKLGKQSAISPSVNTIHQTPPLTRLRLCIILAPSHDPIQPWLVSFTALAYLSEECLGTGQDSMEILFITSHATQSIIPYLT